MRQRPQNPPTPTNAFFRPIFDQRHRVERRGLWSKPVRRRPGGAGYMVPRWGNVEQRPPPKPRQHFHWSTSPPPTWSPTYWEALPALWILVKDMYAITVALLEFNDALRRLLNLHGERWKRLDGDKLARTLAISLDIWSSLAPKRLLGFATPEKFFKNATINKYPEVVRKLARAEAQVVLTMARLATVEECVWSGDALLLIALDISGPLVSEARRQRSHPDFPWFTELEAQHRGFLAFRARARRRLFDTIKKLLTPRLRALDYRRDFFYSDLEAKFLEARETVSSWTPGLSKVAEHLSARLLAQPTVDREGEICPICHESLSKDPNAEDGQEGMRQLPICTERCCNQPYHVCCLLEWLEQDLHVPFVFGSCPTCRAHLSYNFAVGLMERSIVELGTL
ncbi:hypothetical protein Z517_01277 [Fonsecaea pedrosoi CBS 271.37]|uniref:RING-type domain-containing protein n=1 Tax=Fonsecaea pedrosoi CBS 271.37 TaxID=1442368 RepID=A0A0D2HN71_9EURO|nr:uncharacterized protein Z517_01277 [Fonsecaea pedrosoi CBS 271.37]KIW85884.1 hypothetical protein Z517_01277 [Fonsecaea pedrosoi CBS 271.37]